MSDDGPTENLLKILVIGNTQVGKTTLLIRFCQDEFESIPLTTVGILIK